MTDWVSAAKILIVEDSMGVSRALQRALGIYQDGIYQVWTCESGEAALKMLHEMPFDLLISDLRLPGMDGLTVLERARHIMPRIRSLLITAYGSPEIEASARCVANAYLAKPFSIHELIRLVERVLNEPPPGCAPQEKLPEAVLPSIEQEDNPPPRFDRRKSAHLIVLACDLDGTLAEAGKIDAQTWECLRLARNAGLTLILVTGRTLDRISAEFSFDELCEAIVAENGAVLHFPRRDRISLPFGKLDASFLQRMESQGIPLERGLAIAATWVPHDEGVLRALREVRSGAVVEYNRDAVMILPPGASKGTGLLAALQELSYSIHNVAACGDAENDRSLLEVAELGIAVANAQPALKNHADIVLAQPDGAGIRSLIQDMIAGKVPGRSTRLERRLALGYRMSGAPVHLDPFVLVENNLGIFGSSGSGKSWLAGLLAEKMLKQRYQVCIIDPEGDYRGLGASPHTLLLGGPQVALPPVEDVLNISEWNNISLVLDLSMYALQKRQEYVTDFLRALRGLRGRRGRPHFFLVDEIQSFCPLEGGPLTELLLDAMRWGGFCLISYRLSQVAPELLAALDHMLVTRLNLPEELKALRPHLDRYEGGEETLDEVHTLSKGLAFLYLDPTRTGNSDGAPVIKLKVGSRVIRHVRHLQKYLRAPMPEAKRFFFHRRDGRPLGRSAASLWEFREALTDIPEDSLRYHLERGDFEQWLCEIMHDEELARRVHKIASHQLEAASLRTALLEVVIERYEELEMLA
jgi:hydroxymethylpyrimidine pyrophosphatase-like HAD family hydrolase/DNA-binding NarL/FixJ family response regulator